MKWRSLFLTVGLTAFLIGLASRYMSSPRDIFEASNDPIPTKAPATKLPVTDIKLPITDIAEVSKKSAEQNSVDVDPYSELPDHIKMALEHERLHPMSKRIDGIIENSKKSAADRIKHLEEMGQGETFEYLHTYVKDYNAYFNTDVMGETPDQRKAVRARLRESLAINMTSYGLDQARVEELESLDYRVVDGAQRATSFEGNAKDFIALSEDVKFGLNKNGRECLFFTSTNLKRYQEKVFGTIQRSPHDTQRGAPFSPYCVYGNDFISSNSSNFSNQTYDKAELEDLIKEFHD